MLYPLVFVVEGLVIRDLSVSCSLLYKVCGSLSQRSKVLQTEMLLLCLMDAQSESN
jgi:hypothetical protein